MLIITGRAVCVPLSLLLICLVRRQSYDSTNAIEATPKEMRKGMTNTYNISQITRWRHQMETIFAWLTLCARNSLVNVPHKGQWRGALMCFYLCLNKRLSKQSWGWWFETLSRSLWRHCNKNKTPQNRLHISWDISYRGHPISGNDKSKKSNPHIFVRDEYHYFLISMPHRYMIYCCFIILNHPFLFL